VIASLRRRHRVLWVVAGLLLPLLLFLALRARRPELVNEPLPAELAVPERSAPESTR